MAKYSLVNIEKVHPDGLIDETWMQDSTGTLEEAIIKARSTEKANSNRIAVGVVESILSGGPNYSTRIRLERLDA